MMRLVRGPTCIDEPGGGTVGREVGRERELRSQLDEISTGCTVITPSPVKRAAIAPLEAGAELWAQAEAICARNGLATIPGNAKPVAESPGLMNPISRPGTILEPGNEAAQDAAPALRSCPRCGGAMNRAATRCGQCWLRVGPMGDDGVEPAALPLQRPWWKF